MYLMKTFAGVKFSEHILTTKKLLLRRRTAGKFRNSGEKKRLTKLVRIFSTDVDATDSSSDDEGHVTCRVKRHVQEIDIRSRPHSNPRRKSQAEQVLRTRGLQRYHDDVVFDGAVTMGVRNKSEIPKISSPTSVLPDGVLTPFDPFRYGVDNSFGFGVGFGFCEESPLNPTVSDVSFAKKSYFREDEFGDFDCFDAIDFPLENLRY